VQSDARPFNTGRTLIDAHTAETWRRLTHRAVRGLGANDLGYTDPAGLIELRASIGDYLRAARGVRCEPEQVVITAGTQHAIDLAIRVLLAAGDDVWVKDDSRSNRRVPADFLGGLEKDEPAHGFIIGQDREIAEKSSRPPLAIKSS
jgi:histidinol-phosphate/aromatic aminotransferase/cobyric acid decarboxylase-like protein